jgi:glutathione S-transferase
LKVPIILDYLDELAGERDIVPLTPRSGPERRQVQQLMALAIVATEKAVAIEYERKRPGELQWADWTGRLRGPDAAGIRHARRTARRRFPGRRSPDAGRHHYRCRDRFRSLRPAARVAGE